MQTFCNILICRCMQKHIQHHKDEQTQFFGKIYLSLFFERVTKGIIYERWVGDWTELQHINPQIFWLQQHFFPILLGCSTRGPASAATWFSFQHLLSNWSELPVAGVDIIIWRPPTSCERHNSHSIQPFDSHGCPLISSTGCTCYLHRCISSFDSLAGVNMLHF